jgi:hypothetical protein
VRASRVGQFDRRTLIRKTSLLRDRTDGPCGQAKADKTPLAAPVLRRTPRTMLENARSNARPFSRARIARSDLLFTMSENPQPRRSATAKLVSRTRFLALSNTGSRQPTGGARRDRTDDLLLAKQALSQLSYGPKPLVRTGHAHWITAFAASQGTRSREVVGLGRLELPTSRLSSARSNQLSYKPLMSRTGRRPRVPRQLARAKEPTRARPGRKRNGDGGVPPTDRIGLKRPCPDVSKRSDRGRVRRL